jgi:GNAT superfamily N-acetyltransferase
VAQAMDVGIRIHHLCVAAHEHSVVPCGPGKEKVWPRNIVNHSQAEAHRDADVADNADRCGIASSSAGEGEVSAHAEDSAYALLADGTTIEIRPAGPDDVDAVRDMHERMSPDNLYLRFFSFSSVAADWAARRICLEPAADHVSLLAVLSGEVVGYGTFERFGAGSPSAEVAFAVADDMHNRGVGTLLLEHLVSLARSRGVRSLIAETLSDNALMLRVFADAGLQARRALADGVYELTFPLPAFFGDIQYGSCWRGDDRQVDLPRQRGH